MVFDQISLLAAIGFSSTALCITLLAAWLGSRTDTFLLSWAIGMVLIIGGVILFGATGQNYQPLTQFSSFTLIIMGFGCVYAGGMQFRTGKANWQRCTAVVGACLVPTALAFALGWSGVGTILANCGLATILALTAYEYWAGRSESPWPMVATAVLYAAAGFSFLLCGLVLLVEQRFVLAARPENWAEDLNSIVLIIGITGVGALSLAMNQSRHARRHRADAITDQLTGLLNRRALFERFGQSTMDPGTAVIAVDLDHFKQINDRHGHLAGDLVLQRFAEVLRTSIRPTDTSARTGGEEFCAVLEKVSAKTATEVAERIRSTFESVVVQTSKGDVRATVSVGLVICSGEAESFDSLLSRADAALYKAKRLGRNRVFSIGLKLVA